MLIMFESLIERQKSLAKEIRICKLKKEPKTIAGADVAYLDKKAFAVIAIDREKYWIFKGKVKIPYVPGLLSFREGPLILSAFKKVFPKPDLLLIDGHGIAHPRRFGLACWVGLMLNLPTIGVAKSLLVGKIVSNKIIIENEIRGVVLKTKYKPIYVSPGHLITLEESVKIVKSLLQNHRLPEPLHIAHLYSMQAKKRYVAHKAR